MENNKCLNCNSDIHNNFCSVCGQKNSSHRFSIKHFILHDFIHGVFHLDKGFWFTIKELFTRPGHSIREYVQGKRVNHFNYFTLFLIILAVSHFLGYYSIVDKTTIYTKENVEGYVKLAKDYDKILKIISVPFWAVVLFLVFKKSKQNYVEMIVISMYMLCGMLLINLLYIFLMMFYGNIEVLKVINQLITLLISAYFFYFVYQYFSTFGYKKYSLILRSFFAILVIIFLQSFIFNTINKIGKIYIY
jgi:hypothetical protein